MAAFQIIDILVQCQIKIINFAVFSKQKWHFFKVLL